MARGLLGGVLTGAVVSVVGLGGLSLVSEQPAGSEPPAPPQVDAPQVDAAPVAETTDDAGAVNTPVGSLEIEAPQAPALPEGEAPLEEPAAPEAGEPEAAAPRADTDPLDEPEVVSIEGAMEAPETPDSVSVTAQPLEPVLPNPQAPAPQTPNTEADLTVSTAPAAPVIVAEPEADVAPEPATSTEDTVVIEEGQAPDAEGEFFVVDLGADGDATEDVAPEAEADEVALAAVEAQPEAEPAPGPRLQLQGGENTLLGDRDTGVTIRRPAGGESAEAEDAAPATTDALVAFAAEAGTVDARPMMSVILIDDGSMSAAAAALSGLPFPVTIGLEPGREGAAEAMAQYRADGFEVMALAKVPEGALPTDVEVTFESVFSTLDESIGVLDIGDGGLQSDRDVTEQAMEILADQGRGFVTASQGLNMAGRAAEQAGVPAAVVYRDLDADGQDARVIRRFVDQAAFRARQESGVVLVGRVRPDTISALILWGTANEDEQVQLVPVSVLLTAE